MPNDLGKLQQRIAKHHELSHARDLAAYEVLGTARVLFRLVPDSKMAQEGLNSIAEYDRRNKALSEFEKETE